MTKKRQHGRNRSSERPNTGATEMSLECPPDFGFATAVCSHGFFMLAPNRWDPATRTLTTIIALDEEHAAVVRVSGQGGQVLISADGRAASKDLATIKTAIVRMLRLDEDLSEFHALCAGSATHEKAAAMRFGRLLRSATFFEDVLKVICTCNITWSQTVAIVERLVRNWGVPVAGSGGEQLRSFPTPARLARVPVEELRHIARLGYRAAFVHRLAADIHEGRMNTAELEHFDGTSAELMARLRRIRGIGPYAAANLCMLLGRYDHLAMDTELARFLKSRYPRRRWTPAAIRKHFARWQPWQFLAYWFELWQDYTERHGPSEAWSPHEVGSSITRG